MILELGVGEALVSTLEAKGEPSVVQRALIRPPSSRLGPLTLEERRAVIAVSPVKGLYDQTLDRESAHEMLNKATGTAATDDGYERHGEFRAPKQPGRRGDEPRGPTPSSGRDNVTDAFFKSLARSVGSAIPRILERVLRGRFRR